MAKDIDRLFKRRRKNFSKIDVVDDLTAFNLAIVAETLDLQKRLQDNKKSTDVIYTRAGKWKRWDAEIYGFDGAAEGVYIRRLGESGYLIILLSEEAGRVDLSKGKKPGKNKKYCISDPFDGSWLRKRGLPFMQYSSLAFYDFRFDALTAVVGDVINRDLAFANSEGAFIAKLIGDNLRKVEKLDEEYRRKRHGEPASSLDQACVESYVLKPNKFLLPLVDEYRPVIQAFKMLHPNGGPYAFAEAAAGQIDAYVARQQPYFDIFSGIQIAEQADLIVTDFDGKAVPKPTENYKTVFDVLVSRTQQLHDQTLEKIAECRRG